LKNVLDILRERGFIEQTTDDEGIRKLLEERRITSLMVCRGDGTVDGVLHLHDLWGVGLF